ncbi:MAG: hypothetical protein ABJG55_05680, partial [Paracoccaceae bacterium]
MMLVLAVFLGTIFAPTARAQTFTIGDYDVYINDQAGFVARGNQTVFANPTNGSGTAYGNGVIVSSSYTLSLASPAGPFGVSGSATRVAPATGGTDGSVTLTDSSPVTALGFNIVDIFDHGEVGSFSDIITFSANGTTLFSLSDGLSIASSATGPVTLSAPGADGGAFSTSIIQGQAIATFIGVAHNAGGTVTTLQVAYDYNGPMINPGTGLPFNGGADFHGIDQMVEVTLRPIVASDDTPASVSGATASTIPDIVANDSLDGVLDPSVGTGGTVA